MGGTLSELADACFMESPWVPRQENPNNDGNAAPQVNLNELPPLNVYDDDHSSVNAVHPVPVLAAEVRPVSVPPVLLPCLQVDVRPDKCNGLHYFFPQAGIAAPTTNDVSELRKTVLACQRTPPFNILLTGSWGDGKSSVVNTIHRALCNQLDFIAQVAPPNFPRNHTALYTKHKVMGESSAGGQPFVLYDTRGIHDDLDADVFRHCLIGKHKTFREMNGSRRSYRNFPKKHKRIHCIIFVYNVLHHFPKELGSMVALQAAEAGRIPIVVALTHLDTPRCTEALVLSRMPTLANITPSFVFAIANYTFAGQAARPEQDAAVLRLFSKATECARLFMNGQGH